jgi:hypothetical protein
VCDLAVAIFPVSELTAIVRETMRDIRLDVQRYRAEKRSQLK